MLMMIVIVVVVVMVIKKEGTAREADDWSHSIECMDCE